MRRHTLFAASIAISFIGLAANAIAADSTANFFEGKKITSVVPFGAGGNYGIYTQLVSRYMPQYLPGKPTIVPQYMPGAGGNKAASYLYNAAPRDGSYIGMVPDGLVISSVLRPKSIKYKPAQFTWIGSIEGLPTVLMVRSDSGFKSIEDLAKREVILGSSGRGSGTYLFPSLLRWLTGGKIKIVQGYKGVAKMLGAIERGEVQGLSVGFSTWKNVKTAWMGSGFVTPLAQFGVEKYEDLPDTPLAIDLARTPEAKAVARFMASNAEIGRSFVVPPKVPADLISAYRAAFDRMVADPAFLADVKKRRMTVAPKKGTDVQEAVEQAVATGAKLGNIMRTEVFSVK